jgi:acetyltransferase
LVQAVLESSGVITAPNIADQVSITRFLDKYNRTDQGGIALISSAGGPSILAADEIIEMGLRLATLDDRTNQRLSEIVPPQGSYGNPIDILAAADEKLHTDVVEVLLDDPDVATIIIIIVHPVLIEVHSLFERLEPYIGQGTPIICAYLGPDYLSLQKDTKVLVTGSTREAITMIRGAQFYSEWRNNLNKIQDFTHLSSVPQETSELKSLLQQFNFLYPPECISANFDKIMEFIKQEDYPVVMKIEHNKFSHKSDVGGVFLNLRNRIDVELAWDKIMEIYSKSEIPTHEREVSVQPFYENGI